MGEAVGSVLGLGIVGGWGGVLLDSVVHLLKK